MFSRGISYPTIAKKRFVFKQSLVLAFIQKPRLVLKSVFMNDWNRPQVNKKKEEKSDERELRVLPAFLVVFNGLHLHFK